MDKKHITLTVLITILTTVATIALWAGGVSKQQDINTKNIAILQDGLANEITERKDQNTAIFIKLSEIDTTTKFIKQYIMEDKQ